MASSPEPEGPVPVLRRGDQLTSPNDWRALTPLKWPPPERPVIDGLEPRSVLISAAPRVVLEELQFNETHVRPAPPTDAELAIAHAQGRFPDHTLEEIKAALAAQRAEPDAGTVWREPVSSRRAMDFDELRAEGRATLEAVGFCPDAPTHWVFKDRAGQWFAFAEGVPLPSAARRRELGFPPGFGEPDQVEEIVGGVRPRSYWREWQPQDVAGSPRVWRISSSDPFHNDDLAEVLEGLGGFRGPLWAAFEVLPALARRDFVLRRVEACAPSAVGWALEQERAGGKVTGAAGYAAGFRDALAAVARGEFKRFAGRRGPDGHAAKTLGQVLRLAVPRLAPPGVQLGNEEIAEAIKDTLGRGDGGYVVNNNVPSLGRYVGRVKALWCWLLSVETILVERLSVSGLTAIVDVKASGLGDKTSTEPWGDYQKLREEDRQWVIGKLHAVRTDAPS